MKRNVYLLGITSFLNDASSEGVYSLLPLILKDPALIGLVGGIFNGLAYIIKPFSGYLSDRVGKAKPFIITGYLTSAVARSTVAFLSNLLIPIAIIFDRLGKGIRDAPRDILLAETEERGWAFGLHRALDTLGAVTGVALAVYLLSYLLPRIAVLYLSVIGFLTLVPLLFVKEMNEKPKKDSIITSAREASEELGVLVWITLLTGASLLTPALFIDRVVELVGKEGIVLYLVFNVIYALSAYFIGKRSDRYGRRAVLGLGLVSVIGALVLIPFNNVITSLLAFSLFGLGYGAVLPTIFAGAGDRIKKNIGMGMGFIQFVLGLSIMISSFLAGFLIQELGYFAFSLFSLPAFLALLLVGNL